MATKVPKTLIKSIDPSQIDAGGATAQQVLTFNGSTSTWVASAAPQGGSSGNVQAWVSFNGTGTIGSNLTINGSKNVSSVYKNATGDYTVKFTSNMSSINYCVLTTSNNNTPTAGNGIIVGVYNDATSLTLSSVRVSTKLPNAPTTAVDTALICVTVIE